MVMGKYLQMLSAYSIFKEKPDEVTNHFDQFNRDFEQMCQAFKEVTNQTFQAGQEVEALKPVAPVKPTQRLPQSNPELRLSDNERTELQQFFVRHCLGEELLAIFLKEGVALDDVLEMTDTEMKELGINTFSHRKRLLRVIEGVHASGSAKQPGEQSGAAAGSLTGTNIAEETQQESFHLGEAQNSSDSAR